MDYKFLLDLGLILIFAKFFSIISKHFNIPEVVGQILAGLFIGPAVLNIVSETAFIDQVAEVGVIMLMFEAGLETDLQKLKETGIKATLIACGGVFVPLVLGTILFMAFYGFDAPGTLEFNKALFIGAIMTATSVSITVAVLKELGVLNGYVGTTVTSAAIIDDVIGIIVLTVVLGLQSGKSDVGEVILKAVLFFALAIGIGFIIFKLFSLLNEKFEHTRRIPIASLCYCLFMAYVADSLFGIADITGAYVAGVVLCNLKDSEYIERRIDISAYMVFAPVFFASIGLKTTFNSVDARLFIFSICFVIIAMVGKIIGCGGVARLTGSNRRDSLKIGCGMMTRGEVALITAQKGLNAGLLSSDFFTPVILLILCSSIIVPIVLKALFTDSAAKAKA